LYGRFTVKYVLKRVKSQFDYFTKQNMMKMRTWFGNIEWKNKFEILEVNGIDSKAVCTISCTKSTMDG
jgi:hypothetical protein